MRIPLYEPYLCGSERVYVNDCLNSGWISSRGEYVRRFEQAFGDFIGAEYCSSVCNGTVALHVALLAAGVGPGDEVIVPTLTYIAPVNAIAYVGAKPVFVDSHADTWQMDAAAVASRITPRTKAVLAVHLYEGACDIVELQSLCDRHDLRLIEDCAEAFGASINGRHVGTFGDVSTFSFYGNKSITTGEGGMVVCRAQSLHDRSYLLKTQGVSPHQEYEHSVLGYNYRMTNICAAIGLAQIEAAETILHLKRRIAQCYRQSLRGLPVSFMARRDGERQSHWMCCIAVDDASRRDSLRQHMAAQGIETRPFFRPAHTMPVFFERASYPEAEGLSARGINLPSWPGLTEAQLKYVTSSLREYFGAPATPVLEVTDHRASGRLATSRLAP
jgi:perosamine synthetase